MLGLGFSPMSQNIPEYCPIYPSHPNLAVCLIQGRAPPFVSARLRISGSFGLFSNQSGDGSTPFNTECTKITGGIKIQQHPAMVCLEQEARDAETLQMFNDSFSMCIYSAIAPGFYRKTRLGGFPWHGGTPIAGWFWLGKNPSEMDDD